MNESKVVLQYLGGGSIVHVPARDLTEADIAERAELWKENGITQEQLISSGLYQYAIEKAGKSNKSKKDGE